MVNRSLKWHDELKQSVLKDPESRLEYEAFKLQLELADKMKKSRRKADLTQEELANKLHTKKSVIARLEAGGGKEKHSPSLKTLVKYALGIGYKLEVKLKKQAAG